MKFNIELEIEEVNEDYSLSQVFKDELQYKISQQLSEVLAKNSLFQLDKEDEIKQIKKNYDCELEKLKLYRNAEISKINDKIKDEFSDFIGGIAYKTNSWGEPQKETTVGELIREKVSENFKNYGSSLEEMIKKACKEQLTAHEYDIKKLIENEKKKVLDENAKKVAEFIIKGIN